MTAKDRLLTADVITAATWRDAKLLVAIGMTSLFLVGALHATRRVGALKWVELGLATTILDTVNGGHVKKLHVVQIIHAASALMMPAPVKNMTKTTIASYAIPTTIVLIRHAGPISINREKRVVRRLYMMLIQSVAKMKLRRVLGMGSFVVQAQVERNINVAHKTKRVVEDLVLRIVVAS